MGDGGAPVGEHVSDLDVRIVAADALADAAARHVATAVVDAVAARGVCTLAFSGGSTPEGMLRVLGGTDLPWERVHVLQVDERVAPAGSADRNLTMLHEHLVRGPLPATNLHPMPVEGALELAPGAYEAVLRDLAGTPPVLDLVHLGIGSDGHTASLVPDADVLAVTDRDVALTEPYQGRRRVTLTYPILDRARARLWQISGGSKAGAVRQLITGDTSIPAGRVQRTNTTVLVDEAAAAALG